jgi:ketosteroid isomerase-like protein
MTALETVQKFYQEYAEGKIDEALSLFSEDIRFTWNADPSRMKYAGDFFGKAEFRARLADLREDYEYHFFRPIDIIADVNRVVAQVEVELTQRRTGRKFAMNVAEFWTVENGVITHLVEYYDTALVMEMNRPAIAA